MDIPFNEYKDAPCDAPCDTPCTGRFCNKVGLYPLRIIYLNKTCRLCASHRDEFLSLGLVEPIETVETVINK